MLASAKAHTKSLVLAPIAGKERQRPTQEQDFLPAGRPAALLRFQKFAAKSDVKGVVLPLLCKKVAA